MGAMATDAAAVYLIGIAPSIAREDVLSGAGFLGQYGRIIKVVVLREGTAARARAPALVPPRGARQTTTSWLGSGDGLYRVRVSVRVSVRVKVRYPQRACANI